MLLFFLGPFDVVPIVLTVRLDLACVRMHLATCDHTQREKGTQSSRTRLPNLRSLHCLDSLSPLLRPPSRQGRLPSSFFTPPPPSFPRAPPFLPSSTRSALPSLAPASTNSGRRCHRRRAALPPLSRRRRPNPVAFHPLPHLPPLPLALSSSGCRTPLSSSPRVALLCEGYRR